MIGKPADAAAAHRRANARRSGKCDRFSSYSAGSQIGKGLGFHRITIKTDLLGNMDGRLKTKRRAEASC